MTIESEGNKDFWDAFYKLKKKIKVPEKDAANPHFHSKYRSWEACDKALQDAGMEYHFRTLNDENSAGVAWLVYLAGQTVCVNTTFVDKARHDPHSTGGAYTYAMRYCVCTGLGSGLPESDDDANEAMGLVAADRVVAKAHQVVSGLSAATIYSSGEEEPEVDTSFDFPEANETPPVAPDKSEALTDTQIADLMIGFIKMIETIKGWNGYWTDNHSEMTALQSRSDKEYSRVVEAYRNRKIQIQEKEKANGSK